MLPRDQLDLAVGQKSLFLYFGELKRSVKRGRKYLNPFQQQRLVMLCILSNTEEERPGGHSW